MTRTAVLSLIIAALCFSAIPATAQKYERKVEKRIEVQANPSVTVDGRFGPITVTGAEQNTVDVRVLITAEDDNADDARRRAEDVSVTIDGTRSSVRVSVDFRDKSGGSGRHSINADIRVTVPKQALVEIRNKFGSSKVTGVEGSVSLQNEFGSAETTGCGNVRIANAFGATVASAIRGSLSIEGKNGKVRAFDVPGCTIRNAFGEIELSDAHGPVNIIGRMGAIKARGIPGGTIENSYGSVLVSMDRGFSGTIEATTRFGSIDSDFPLESRVKRSEKQYGPVPEDMIGRIGSGSARLRVVNEFGEITIRKK